MRNISGWVESSPLTNMRNISGWVESVVLRCEARDFLYMEVILMKQRGFYIIKDSFFEDMNEPYLKGNKKESRPHYYCLEDSRSGIYWMIPLSSNVKKYENIIKKKLQTRGTCDTLHIAELADNRKSVFLIQDIFPITEKYIEREYIIAGNHLMLTSVHIANEVEKKAKTVITMLRRGIKFMPTQPDINRILSKLEL